MTADLILINGTIYTLDDAEPQTNAVAMRDGRILALGERALSIGRGERVDLGGRTVIPGLHDAHVHFRNFALGLTQVDLAAADSLSAALQIVERYVAETAPGEWIQGWGWSQDRWPSRQFPTLTQLNVASPQNPAYLRHKSGHAAWVNTPALRLAGIDRATPDPDGGQIQRDEQGLPTGILFETAAELVARVIPPPSNEQITTAMRQAQQICWQAGLVGLHDFDGRDSFQALQTLHAEQTLGLRIVKNIPAALVEHAVRVGLRSGFGDDWLRIGGIKIFADGALGPRTARMIRPYEGEPQNRGVVVTEKEEMARIAELAMRNGLSVTTHAIGDQAVHDVLDVYETVQRAVTERPRLRNRIEHVQLLHPADHDRLAQLDVIASMQPTHATSDMQMVDRYWGERGRHSYNFRSLLDSGATLVFGSDCPIEPIDPLPGIHAAVTRRRRDGTPGKDGWYGEQRLTVAQAVRAFTLAAAETSGQQHRQGTITPSKLADLTILEQDIFKIDPNEIADAAVAATIVAGDFKYRTF